MDRVLSALNFLTDEGVSYPHDCDSSAVEALVMGQLMMRIVMTKVTTKMKVGYNGLYSTKMRTITMFKQFRGSTNGSHELQYS